MDNIIYLNQEPSLVKTRLHEMLNLNNKICKLYVRNKNEWIYFKLVEETPTTFSGIRLQPDQYNSQKFYLTDEKNKWNGILADQAFTKSRRIYVYDLAGDDNLVTDSSLNELYGDAEASDSSDDTCDVFDDNCEPSALSAALSSAALSSAATDDDIDERLFIPRDVSVKMSCSSNTINSIYIPTVKKCYSDEKIMLLFWRHGLGKVDRVDFVPIIKENDIECPYFKQAFLYVDSKSAWHPDIVESVEKGQPYKIYPNKDEAFEHLRDEKEYWLILKNKCPVPYATTTLNVHQLANNLALLEQQMAEREAQLAQREAQLTERELEVAQREAQLAEKEPENNRQSCESEQIMEENKTYCLSYDNLSRIMGTSTPVDKNKYFYDDDHYEEFSRSDRFHNDDDEDNHCYAEFCSDCHREKLIVVYNWRYDDDNLCEDCVNLLTEDEK
jgi:uncharacterized protein YgiM (DUF1202 family)